MRLTLIKCHSPPSPFLRPSPVLLQESIERFVGDSVEAFGFDSESMKKCQVKIGKDTVLRSGDMVPGPDATAAAPEECNGDVERFVSVAVFHSRAEQNNAVVQ